MATKRKLVKVNNRVKEVIDPVVSGAAVWGSISGTLSSQSDLQSALNTKQASYAILSTLGLLANASGVLSNNGAGVLSWATPASGTVTSVGISSTDLSVSGSPITTSGSITLDINNNAVTYAKFQQVAALSVVGNGTNAIANASAITGTANQVLVVNGAGTSLAFGQVNLSSANAVTGTLGEGKGGTGNNSYAIGDLLYASGATALSKLADVSVGSYLRSGGVTTAPLWSTLKLPNSATQYYVPYPATANNYNESSNFQFDGTNLSVGGASSSHRFNLIAGTLGDQKSALNITATFPTSPTTHNNYGVNMVITSAGSASFNQYALNAQLAAGYTGSLSTYAIRAVNSAAGTGTFEPFVANTSLAYNAAIAATSITSTSGSNFGYWNLSRSGAVNCAMFGLVDLSRSNGKNYGVFGNVNAATSGTSINVGTIGVAINGSVMVGGFFGLLSSVPTLTSSALICDNGSQTSDIFVARDNGTAKWSIVDGGNTTWADAVNMVFNATTGTKIGTATTQKIGVWNATPIVQPTNAVAAATFVANTSAIVDDTATFDGYTIGQVVKALRNIGLLA